MERWMPPAPLVHPCSSTGLVPPAADEGVNALWLFASVGAPVVRTLGKLSPPTD
jgi:hypothetical protein